MQNQQQPLASPTVIVSGGTAVPTPGRMMYMRPDMVTHQNYRHKESIGLGVAQIVLGSLCIVFNGVALGFNAYYNLGFVGHGFWCGTLFIFTGAFGISAGLSKTKCKIVAYMGLCITAACFTAALLGCGILGAFLDHGIFYNCNDYYGYRYGYYYNDGYYGYQPPSGCSTSFILSAMEGCMAVSGFIAAILFIWGSTLCCMSSACGCCFGFCNYCVCCSCCGCGECCVSPQTQRMHVEDGYVREAHVPFVIAINNGQMMQAIPCSLPTMPYQTGAMAVPPPYQTTFAQPYFIPAPVASGMAVGASTTSVMATTEDPPKY